MIIIIIIVICMISFSLIGGLSYYYIRLKTTTTTPSLSNKITTPSITSSFNASKPTTSLFNTTKTNVSTTTNPSRTYSIYNNIDYKNQGDISTKYNSNPSECKKICDNTPNCNGFITNGSLCVFKTKDVKTPSISYGYDYYYTGFIPNKITETPNPVQKRDYSIMKNTEYKHQSNISERHMTNPEECKIICDGIDNCNGFITKDSSCFFKTNEQIWPYLPIVPSVLEGWDYYKKI